MKNWPQFALDLTVLGTQQTPQNLKNSALMLSDRPEELSMIVDSGQTKGEDVTWPAKCFLILCPNCSVTAYGRQNKDLRI